MGQAAEGQQVLERNESGAPAAPPSPISFPVDFLRIPSYDRGWVTILATVH